MMITSLALTLQRRRLVSLYLFPVAIVKTKLLLFHLLQHIYPLTKCSNVSHSSSQDTVHSFSRKSVPSFKHQTGTWALTQTHSYRLYIPCSPIPDLFLYTCNVVLLSKSSLQLSVSHLSTMHLFQLQPCHILQPIQSKLHLSYIFLQLPHRPPWFTLLTHSPKYCPQ